MNVIERNSALIKLAIVGVLAVLLLIPLSMIQSLINERAELYKSVRTEIGNSYGGVQELTGPYLSVPYYETRKIEGEDRLYRMYVHLLPEELNIKGSLDTAIRNRNIYKLMVYSTDLEISGVFDQSKFEIAKIPASKLQWENAVLNLGVSDLKGIREETRIMWGDSSAVFGPGLSNVNVAPTGISVPLKVSDKGKVSFSMDLALKGSEGLFFKPLGKQTRVNISSSCPNPSFKGSYLPDFEKSETGFAAQWNILELNRSFPQAWTGAMPEIDQSDFGLNLMMDVEHYQKTMRSVKYAMLFIVLTFLSFFFIEILNAKRIHPVQYTLIGLTLVVFYILLLSLSETFGFNVAYWLSTGAVILLLSTYIAAALKSVRLTGILTFVLVLIYAFIYVIIQLANYSLLMGSIGLFVFLAILMIQSRNVDWYSIGNKKENEIAVEEI
ncbi:cell envelope integrity protein CreD [bacterium]|nr:cell envelope integrity protein CreD [bacterium]